MPEGPVQATDRHCEEQEEQVMQTTSDSTIRELDSRTRDGISVRLLWNSQTNRVSVVLEDARTGESFDFKVNGADALAAFHHPYAYMSLAAPAAAWPRAWDHTGERS
jgi:hypothetical protein